MRQTVKHLVTSPNGLGYCCEWFFFTHFRQTQVIASRLGVTDRAVRLAKARVDDGESTCENGPRCMNCKVTRAGTPRKMPIR